MKDGKVALVTGITGQDGAYLTDLLLKKGYHVHGIKRRSSLINTQRVDHFYTHRQNKGSRFTLHYGDLTDSTNVIRLMQKIQPDEVYNLAAQSHVQVSFDSPEYTANADAIGALRCLDAIKLLGLNGKTRFYQASTSELYGKVQQIPQTETTPFYPRSPYAVAKLYAYWVTINYREAYGIHASNGILFNHESPLRGETFITRKVTREVARIVCKQSDCLYVGNLDAKRDWGHAREYVEGMWRMVQQETSDDYVLATGHTTSVRDFIRMAFKVVDIDIEFSGEGLEELGRCKKTGKTYVKVDSRYFRPTEVDLLIGDASKAEKKLKWKSKITVEQLCEEMVKADLCRLMEEGNLKQQGQTIESAVMEDCHKYYEQIQASQKTNVFPVFDQ